MTKGGEIVSETPEVRNIYVDRIAELEHQRDELRVLWERDSKALGVAIGQRDNARAAAEDNRARYVTAEAQRDELAAALRELYLIADTIRRAHWMHWQSEETYKLTASINRARAICDAIGARLGEGGEG